MQKFLFLDFDGVLHPQSTEPPFCQAYLLEALLSQLADPPTIVISSSWRFQYSLDEMRRLLPPCTARRIAYATGPAYVGKHPRWNEIRQWIISASKQLADWRALDDAHLEFPESETRLIRCNPRFGLSEHEVQRLAEWLL